MIDIHLHSLGPHESVKSLIYFLVNSSCHFDNKDFKVFVVTDPGFSKYAVVRLSYLSTEDILPNSLLYQYERKGLFNLILSMSLLFHNDS